MHLQVIDQALRLMCPPDAGIDFCKFVPIVGPAIAGSATYLHVRRVGFNSIVKAQLASRKLYDIIFDTWHERSKITQEQ